MVGLPILPESVQTHAFCFVVMINLLLEYLVLTLSKTTKTVLSSSQTPTLDDTAIQIQVSTRRMNSYTVDSI